MNETLDFDVLRLILGHFDGKHEAYCIRLVCKRWAKIMTPPKMNLSSIAAHYVETNSRSILELIAKTGYS